MELEAGAFHGQIGLAGPVAYHLPAASISKDQEDWASPIGKLVDWLSALMVVLLVMGVDGDGLGIYWAKGRGDETG